MQDRYTGDIGDYVKLAILRALAPGRVLGVAWWLYPDESHNNGDGRHTGYLDQPERWRAFDPAAFDHLRAVVASDRRHVAALEDAGLLPGARFFREPVPTGGTARERRTARTAWLGRLVAATDDCDLLFLDPDNGFETKDFDLGAARAGKSVALSELQALQRPGRTLLVYHHQTRMRGGHDQELEHWGERLRGCGFRQVDALRASAYSARAFFLLDAAPELRARASALAGHSPGRLSWRPDLGRAAASSGGADAESCVATSTRLLSAAASERDLDRRGDLIREAMEWHARAVSRRAVTRRPA
jgi:hypothetical protein